MIAHAEGGYVFGILAALDELLSGLRHRTAAPGTQQRCNYFFHGLLRFRRGDQNARGHWEENARFWRCCQGRTRHSNDPLTSSAVRGGTPNAFPELM